MDEDQELFSIFAGGVRLPVKARPGLNKPRPPRRVTVGDGQQAIEITVAEAPEDGKANKAILAQLAKALGLKKAQLSIKTGGSGRLKLVEIEGDPATLAPAIRRWAETLAD